MIGTKFNKSDYNLNDYSKCAEWCVKNNARIEDKGEYFECVEIPNDEKLSNAKAIAQVDIQQQLAESDYKCLKYVDGDLTATEYKATKAERKALREKYNDIEACETLEQLQELL